MRVNGDSVNIRAALQADVDGNPAEAIGSGIASGGQRTRISTEFECTGLIESASPVSPS